MLRFAARMSDSIFNVSKKLFVRAVIKIARVAEPEGALCHGALMRKDCLCGDLDALKGIHQKHTHLAVEDVERKDVIERGASPDALTPVVFGICKEAHISGEAVVAYKF